MHAPSEHSVPALLQRITPRVATVNPDEKSAAVLRNAFKHAGIEFVVLPDTARLDEEKFEGCVVDLAAKDAQTILQTARLSARNRRIVVYGIYSDVNDLSSCAAYGINAQFESPLERINVSKVIRATQLLLLHELRRYIRIPLVMRVDLKQAGYTFKGVSRELSGGGMSIKLETTVSVADAPVLMSFTLPGGAQMNIDALPCWRQPEQVVIGLQFDFRSPDVTAVRKWIDDYLALGVSCGTRSRRHSAA